MPTTLTSSLITGSVIKTKSTSLINTVSLASFEAKIAAALLSESSVANGTGELDSLIGTTNRTGPNHRSESFLGSDIEVVTSTDLTNRNHIIVANYVSNADTTTNGEQTNTVRINNTTNPVVTSKVLDDSSSYKNTSVRVTLEDPYFTPNTVFSDVCGNYNCTFDASGNQLANGAKVTHTRNVNANTAHSNDTQSTIIAVEHQAWNTNNEYGPNFVNGYVTIDSTTGQPTAFPYANDNSLNILSKLFTVALKDDDVSNNLVPLFGRYQATFSSTTGSTVTVDITGSDPSLVVTTDPDSWDLFEGTLEASGNINLPVPLTDLPNDISAEGLVSWVLPETDVNNGFTLTIASQSFTSQAIFYNASYSSPISLNLSNMDFAIKNEYILEKSMETNATVVSSTVSNGTSTLTNPTIQGTTYENKLTVTNGSLALQQTFDASNGYYVLLDGVESLSSLDISGGEDGIIQSYNSSRISTASDSPTVFPRASRTAVSSTAGILDNFAVQYKASESGYESSVGLLTGTDLTALSVTYDVTTLAGQTTTLEGSANWSNTIGVNNKAIAIVKDTNPSITISNISFHENSNDYSANNENKLSVIDIACNKLWSESKVYRSIEGNDAEITGITADVKSVNMGEIPLDLKDIRFVFTAKVLGDLSLVASDNAWTLSCPDTTLISTTDNLGVIDDNVITNLLLTGDDTASGSISVVLKPRTTQCLAKDFTKFHQQIEITHNGNTQITYNDEFEILGPPNKVTHPESAEITNFLNVPANTKLFKRSFTETFKVKIPLRFGYYDNLFLTSKEIEHTVEYYVLKDTNNNNADLPRYFLNGVKTNEDAPLYATITPLNWTTNISFTNKDFKPYKIGLEKKDADGIWESVTLTSPAHGDIWYNTPSTIISPIGSFNLALTLPPNVSSLSYTSFFIDLELDKGTSSFTISGKNFSASDLNSMSGTNLNTFALAGSSYGQAISYANNAVSYTRDSVVGPNNQAATTLTAAGFTFKLVGEMYLGIRIFVCPNGIFKSVKTSDLTSSTTYLNIVPIAGTPSLILDTGVYANGSLNSAIRGTSSATLSLNSDAISATYYGTTGFAYQRISSLNQEFRPVTGARGFKTTIVRGFTPNLSTTIDRTLSTVTIDLAGYTFSTSLLNDINADGGTNMGGITMSSNSGNISMYPTTFGTRVWSINLGFGSYAITDVVIAGNAPVISYIPSYKTLISDRKGLKLISTSLNTNDFTYQVQYSSANSLTIRRNPDITAPNFVDNSAGYSFVIQFTPEELRATTGVTIGNVLLFRYTQSGTIPDMNCQFSICPPYLEFSAIDPSGVTSIPFNSTLQTPVKRYLPVNNVNTSTPGTYYPFLNHPSIDNIKFAQQNVKQYLAYYNTPNSSLNYMNLNNYNIKVELGSGLDISGGVSGYVNDWSTIYGPTPILTNSEYSDDKIRITPPDSTRKFQIFINQQKHPSFSNFFIYDSSFAEYNLQLEIGSSFISGPSVNGSNSILLEFVAGDCTSLDLYTLRTLKREGDNLQATIDRYQSGAGISSQFLISTSSSGISIPYSSKSSATMSVALNSSQPLGSTVRTLSSYLDNLKTSLSSTTFSSWTTESVGDNSPKLTLIAGTSAGKQQIVNFLTLSPVVSKSILSLTLQDLQRLEDIFGVPKYRVPHNGSVLTQAAGLFPSFSSANHNYSIPTSQY